jgi:hypothetical protein
MTPCSKLLVMTHRDSIGARLNNGSYQEST